MPRDYHLQWTVEAQRAADAMPPERRTLLDKGIVRLTADPYGKYATSQIGPAANVRKAYVAEGMVVEYVVANAIMVIVLIEVFEITGYLVDDASSSGG